MDGLWLLVGHLIGDYIVQNDLMASNKSSPGILGFLCCTTHCLLYSAAVLACSFWWMPWWGAIICFAVHWPIDRYRLAAWWMRNVSGQAFFASPQHLMFPWSIVVVDNTFHILTLVVLASMVR